MTNILSKNSFLNHKLLSKTNIAILCMLGMMLGFLLSRALLSTSMIVLGVLTLFRSKPKDWIKDRFWILGFIWVAFYAISYFWSDDKSFWGTRVEVKLPILLLPAVFCCLPSFSIKQLRFLTLSLAIILILSTTYTIWYLYFDATNLVEQYKYSKVLPTLAQDHIRYSLFIALFIIWSIYFSKHLSKSEKIIVGIIGVLLTIFLHILAVRTGLLAVYLFLILYSIYRMFSNSLLRGILIMVGIVIAGILSYKYVPTVRNKVDYVKYSFQMYEKGEHTGNYSDIGRVLSFEIAGNIFKENKLKGVGAGDMMTAMNAGYDKWHPYVIEYDRKMPHNQFYCVALAAGIFALLFFILWVIEPLSILRFNRDGFYFFSIWLILLALLSVEPMLEIQKGIFVHLFFLLLMRHVIKRNVI